MKELYLHLIRDRLLNAAAVGAASDSRKCWIGEEEQLRSITDSMRGYKSLQADPVVWIAY